MVQYVLVTYASFEDSMQRYTHRFDPKVLRENTEIDVELGEY